MEDVLRIGKKLDKMTKEHTVDASVALDLLKSLQRQKITLDILQKTRIGMTVNNFRKYCNDDEVVSLAKLLIKGWKKLLPESKPIISSSSDSPKTTERSNSVKSGSSPKETGDESMDSSTLETSADAGTAKEEQEAVIPPPERQMSFPDKPSETSDPTRIKCRELLANALRSKDIPEGSLDPDELGASIEDHIFAEFKNTDMKYKNRVRSRVANLKDQKNPNLRKKVLFGILPTEKIAVMSSVEMASDDMKVLRDKLTKEAIKDHQMAVNGGTATDLFKCNKCGKRNCTYNQLQTRSADEPMTTFVVCNECGNRWKFC